IDTYLDKVLIQNPDTLIPEVDMLIEKSRTNDELFRYMLIHLFNKYASSQVMTAENVYVHIADKYYTKEAKWSDPEFISELKTKIKNRKKCLIGVTAQNITFNKVPKDTSEINKLIAETDKIKAEGLKIEKSEADSTVKYNLKVEILKEFYDKFPETEELKNIKAKYTILWFWTPDCSHCRKETPLFHDAFNEKNMKDKGVEVVTIFLQKDLTDWKRFSKVTKDWLSFIKKHDMTDWTNGWDPFDPFRINYDIHSSPVLYLLDENKKIIAKRIGYEQALEIIEAEMKQKEKEGKK
ncbi:MAG: TlpA family protein disulfide reductase, partial [Chlorobi bacterium]|nr:TlpA family protein disulfide reductase [Chlorobiota bacterium]